MYPKESTEGIKEFPPDTEPPSSQIGQAVESFGWSKYAKGAKFLRILIFVTCVGGNRNGKPTRASIDVRYSELCSPILK